MKNHLGLVALLFCFNLANSQETVDIVVAGIDASIEKSLLPGDRVSYFEFDDGAPVKNIKVVARSYAGNKNFFGSVDVTAVNGHYDFNQSITLKESSKLPLDGEIELLVSMPTIYGNSIWTKVVRNKSNFTDPIILDHYSEKADKDFEARKRFALNFTSIAYDQDLKKKVTENGDKWGDRKKEDFRFMLKNVGDSDWKINEVMKIGSLTNGSSANAKINNKGQLDLNKLIVMRVEVTTEKGNLLWNEVEFEARGMNKTFFGINYEIVDKTAPNIPVVEETTGVTENPANTVTDGKVDNMNADGGKKDDNNINTTTVVTTTTATSIKPIITGTTDLTTQTLKADCSEKASGDTLMLLSGSSVCVRQLKPEGSKKTGALLAVDCNFKIGEMIFPLKGNEKISFATGTGQIVEGVLRADVSYNSKAGTILLKEGTLVAFNGDQLIAGSLAEAATLNINGVDVACATNSALPFDIRFDNQGRLQECTIAAQMKWTNGIDLSFPANSRLVYKGDNLNRVISAANSSFQLDRKTIQVKGDLVSAAYEFNSKNELESVNSGAGNSIDIEGQSIAIEEGKEIKLILAEGTYSIEKFFVAKEVKVNVYKKDKQKEVIVKAGKKIVLSEGKVVKAG